MPREATGELRHLADGFAARITIHGRDRKDFPLTTCETEPEAQARCRALAEMAARLRKAGHAEQIEPLLTMGAKARAGKPWDAVIAAVDTICSGNVRDRGKGAIPTLTEWARQWISGELAKRFKDHIDSKRSSKRDEELFRIYVQPHVGHVRVDEFTLNHAKFVMANIPDILPKTGRPPAQGQRRHIAQVVSRLMRIAVFPGELRKDNPIPPGWLPGVGEARAKEALYPDEDALLLVGKSVRTKKRGKGMRQDVPLLRRLAYGILSREGIRVDELSSLSWRDVDLKRGRINLDRNKTDDPRDWDLQPDVVETLRRWKAHEGEHATADARVISEDGVPLPMEHLADRLRFDLWIVGVDRPQLFERSDVRQPIRAHDLRATFVTISLAIGKSETFVTDRTGHQSLEMVNAYRRKSRTWNMGPLSPLHTAIPEIAALPASTESSTPIAPRIPLVVMSADDSHFAQRKPIAHGGHEDSRSSEKTSHIDDPRSPEMPPIDPPQGQSRGNHRAAELEAAIANMTALLARTDDPKAAAELVAERRAMREELEALRFKEAGGRSIDEARRRR